MSRKLESFTTAEIKLFWSRVDRSGPKPQFYKRLGPCWIYRYERWSKFRPEKYGDFKGMAAHRMAFFLKHGPVRRGIQICHRCDNLPCCNPRHLFPGSVGANANDRARKGRQWAGREVPLGFLIPASPVELDRFRRHARKKKTTVSRWALELCRRDMA